MLLNFESTLTSLEFKVIELFFPFKREMKIWAARKYLKIFNRVMYCLQPGPIQEIVFCFVFLSSHHVTFNNSYVYIDGIQDIKVKPTKLLYTVLQ